MENQKRLLLFPMLLGFAYGIVGLLFPSIIHSMFRTPIEQLNPALNQTGAVLALSQFSLGLLIYWMRKIDNVDMLNSGMKIVSFMFLLFALENMFASIIIEGLTYSVVSSVQGLIFLIVAIIFYLNSKQKK